MLGRSMDTAIRKLLLVESVLVLIAVTRPTLALAQASQSRQVQPLLTRAVDETKLTRLKGNTHPLARPAFDQGAAPASLPMNRMLLVLRRSPEQESALTKLLDGTALLTVTATAPHQVASLRLGNSPVWMANSVILFGGILLIGLPQRRHRWTSLPT